MKKSQKILKILTAVFAVIGLCVIALLFFIFIYIYINGSFPQRADSDSLNEPASSVQEEASSVNESEDSEATLQAEAAAEEESPSPTPAPTAIPQKVVESGSYNIYGTDFWFSDSVINDTSGRLKISSLAADINICEYAAQYYNTLFSNDNEIHAVINFTTNTTSSISVLQDGMLDVAIHEYISGEEHDAQTLFSGALLEEYFVDIETGEIKEN